MAPKILIVEDEPNIIVPLRFTLEQNGYAVITASSGEEAMEKITASKPDLILLDIMLPGMDGYEVCQRVHENPESQHTKVIFLSAMGRDMDVAKGVSMAADAYIIKPFSVFDVITKIGELLKGESQ
jgi:two-component system alkaline phosphatase synthesis response regulator PhoP